MGADDNIEQLSNLSREALENFSKEQFIDLVLVLVEQNRQLQARVQELERRLNTNSTNSSNPPSSDPPGTEKKKSPKKKKRKRKRGGQKGHEGHHRTLVPEEQVNKFVDVKPCTCENCGGHSLEINPNKPWRHQVVELLKVLSEITEYRVFNGICTDCGHSTRAELPVGVPTRHFGPRLESFVSYLSGSCHLAKRRTQELLKDIFGIDMSLGAISTCEAKVSESLEASYIEARQTAEKEEIAHADESGWREGLERAWLWVFVTTRLVIFMVDKERSKKAAKRLLNKFEGILVCDRYGAYNVHKGQRQFCWAHLLRRFIGFSELPGKPGKIGEQLVEKTLLMFHWLHRVRDGTLMRKTFEKRMKKLRIEIENLLIDGEMCGHDNMAGVCKRILKLSRYLWTFLENEQVPPTNNEAERAIRAVVLWRKGSFGTQSERGSRFVERILTVVSTCRRQGRSVFEFLTDARIAHLNGYPTPSLLPT